MGRGGYLGGSTIVGGFGWSSFDPASGGRAAKKHKANANQSSSANKKARKVKRPPDLNLLRLTYLEAIIDAALRAQPAPVPPKRARAQLNAATLSAGGPTEWAKAQPEFAATLERKQKKLARKAQTLSGSRREGLGREANVPKKAPKSSETLRAIGTRSIEALCLERAQLSTALIEAEAEVSKYRKAIAEIDRLLAAANTE